MSVRLTMLLLGVALSLFGCTRGAEVVATIPSNGQTGVSKNLSQIELDFSTELEEATATDLNNVTVVGEFSGTQTLEAELTANAAGEEGRKLILRAAGASNFTFADGEMVSVTVTRRIRSSTGIPIRSDAVAFEISGVSGEPDDFDPAANQFLVRSTEPPANSQGARLRPPVRVDFAVAAFPDDIEGAVVVRGESSGFRFGGEIATSSMTQPVGSFTYALGASAPSFQPGERVTVTLRPGIEAPPLEVSNDPNAPNPNRALRPYSFEFAAANGVMNLTGPGFQDPIVLNPTTGEMFQSVRGLAVANFAFGDDNEIALLDEFFGLALLRRAGAGWFVDSVFNDFGGTPVAMQLTDLDQGRGPDLVVAVRNPNRLLVLRYATPFAPIAAYTVELGATETPNSLAVADLDNNGTLDLIVGTATGLFVYSQLPLIPMDSNLDFQSDFHSVTGFLPAPIRLSSGDVLGFEVGDLDEDGRMDIVAVERNLGMGIYRNAGNLSLPRVQELDASYGGRVWQLEDLEGDGDLDVIVAVPGGIGAYLVDLSTSPPTGAVTVPIGENLVSLALPRGTPDAFTLRDVTGDGLPDLLAYYRMQNTLSFQPRVSNATNDLGASRDFTVAGSFADAQLACGDANQDGGVDVFAFGVVGAAATAVSYLASTGITPPDELPEFSFRVPSQVTGQLGDPTFSVLVRGDLSAAVAELDIRMEFDSGLELRSIELDPVTFPAGAATLTPSSASGVGRAQIVLGAAGGAAGLQPGTNVALARFSFSLSTPEVGSFTYRLRNGAVGMTTVQNSVLLLDGTRVTVDLATAGVGALEVGTSVPSVINLVCTPRSEEDNDGNVTHHIDATWERPSGVVYDSGLGGVQVTLNGGSPIQLLGAVEAYTFDGVAAGANVVRVMGHLNGLASAPTVCNVFIVSPPSDFTCTRISTMPPRVSLSWTRNANYDSLRLFRDGAPIMNDGSGLQTSFLDTTPTATGGHEYRLVASVLVSGTAQDAEPVTCAIPDQDGVVTPPNSISVSASADQVTLSWQNAESYDAIEVRRGGSVVGQIAGSQVQFVETAVPPGVHTYTLTFTSGAVSSPAIGTTPPTVETTLPGPTSLTCATAGSDVMLSWVNAASYDTIEVHRLDVASQMESVVSIAGAETSYLDASVPEGSYTYRLVAVTGGFASGPRGTCQVTLRSRIAVVGLVTSLGLEEFIEIRADVLDPLTEYSFSLTYDPQDLTFGTPPAVLLDTGLPAPPGAVTDVPDTGGRRRLTVSLTGVSVAPGTDVVLATLVAAVSSNFAAVGSTVLDLVDGAMGPASPLLEDASIVIAGDAMLIFSDIAVAGESLEVTVYGTFDQRVAGYTTLLRFDPEVVQVLGISPLGTIAEVVANPQFFGLNNFNNDLGYANAAFIDLSIPPQGAPESTQNLPPSTLVPLFHFEFQVNAGALPGTDTGIELVLPEALTDLGVSTQRPVYVDQTANSIFPVLLNGAILVAEDPTPVANSVTPAQGALYGGETVTIQGTSLVGDNLQVFFGSRLAQVVTATPTALQVIVPALLTLPNPATPVTVDVTVSHSAGAVTLVGAYTYRVATVTSVSPNLGVSGLPAVVNGTFFGSNTAGLTVRFGTELATVQSLNPAGTAISVLVPPGAGTVSVIVQLPGQLITLTDGFSYLAQPVIVGLTPATGPFVGGGGLTLTGQNLAGAALSVTFGGVAAVVNASSPTSIALTVPALAQAPAADAPVDVVVTTSGGSSAPATYTYQILRVTSVAPATGSSAGGETVQLNGTGLAAAGTVVEFGASAATVQSVSADGTQLTVVTPAGSGTVDLTVTLSDGQSTTLAGAFAYSVPAPSVTAISPATGPLSGLGTVTVTGSNLNLPGLSVSFGGVAATVVPGSVTAAAFDVEVPPFAGTTSVDATVDVLVSHAGGVSAPVPFTYQVLALNGLTPAQGTPLGGNSVTLQGAGFAASGATVAFGGVQGTVVSSTPSGAEMTVLAPAGSGNVDVSVTLGDGQSATLVGAYSYSALLVSSLSPTFGDACGGTAVVLSGTGFVPGEMVVTFNGVSATSVQVDPSGASMTVVTPFVGEGDADVVVSHSPTAGVVTLPAAYTYGVRFLRGDVNDDGAVNPADLSVLASFVVGGGGMPPILDAADVNDDGLVAVGDLVLLSAFLQQSPPITLPPPTAAPDFDPTPDFLCQ
ncbi:MAG: IPT/TIG domain-containing protein [Planctomycetota bacterium]